MLGIWTDQYGGRRVYTVVMLAAAVATYLLTWAHTYPEFLVAALFVGIAGGSFAVGIAYVSRFYPTGKQGTALGIFGAGNVGAAVTKFVAPFVLVAYGWQTVAQVWALVIGLMGIIFWIFSEEDPVVRARREKNEKPKSAWLELEPLKNVQVWRFALYYFFVFGAFVALSLWLPQYLIKVYGVDIKTAGMMAAMFSFPASVFRAYGGHLSDRYGARRVMYWTFLVAVVCHLRAVLSADRLCGEDGQRHRRLPSGNGPGAVHGDGVRARLLHGAGQGRRLQAHPGLLSEQCRRRRRSGRHDRRARRLRAADRVRCAGRSHRPLDQLLHAAVPAGRRVRWSGCTSRSGRWSAGSSAKR